MMKMQNMPRIFLNIAILCFFSFTCAEADDAGEGYLPRFGGAGYSMINLAFDASPFTGEATTTVPISLFPSAGDIQDKINIELQYRSGGSNSWVGRGWELEIGYIARVNKFGANNPENPYVLSLNGQSQELVSIGSNQYRTKSESFRRIEFNGSTWQAWDPDGTQYKFELSAAGRWVLTKVTNTHGISAVIEYDRPNESEIYLREIRYPEGQGLSPYCKVVFVSDAREDKLNSYYYGQVSKTNRLLKEVQLLVEGRIQKKYALSYSTDGKTQVSFLSSVVEYGKDGKSLPPTAFHYEHVLTSDLLYPQGEWLSDGQAYAYEGAIDTTTGTVPVGINMAVIDLNGDNLPDFIGCKRVVTSNPNKHDWVAHLNTGTKFSSEEAKWLDREKSYITLTTGTVTNYQSLRLCRYAALVDMDKDGLPDLVYSKLAGMVSFGAGKTASYDIVMKHNTGSGFSDTEIKLLDYTKTYYIDTVLGAQFMNKLEIGLTANLVDMNADGLPDLVYHRQKDFITCGTAKYSAHDWNVRLNTGSGFSDEEMVWLTSDKSYLKYELFIPGRPIIPGYERINIQHNSMLTDMNNDGLPDLVFNSFAASEHNGAGEVGASYNIKVRYNTGSKFSDEAVTLYANTPVYFYTDDYDVKASSVKIGENGTLADINNDGLPDFVFNKFQAGSSGRPDAEWMVCYNAHEKFLEPLRLFGSIGYFLNMNNNYTNVLIRNSYLVDVNKDGLVDLVYPQFIDYSLGNTKFNLKVYINRGFLNSALLIRQVSPFGGKTDMDYAPSSGLPFIIPLVHSVTKDPGIGESGQTTYTYEGGLYDIPKRQFRGFNHVQATDPLNYISHTYFHQDDPRLGKVQRQENSVTRVINTYKEDSAVPYFTPPAQIDEYIDSKCKRTAYDYDTYGNIVKISYHGDIAVSGDEKSVFADYSPNSSSWILNLPSRERAFGNMDGSGIPASEAQYFYDNNSSYSDMPVKGDLTKVRKYLNTISDYTQVISTYDVYGNEITKTDANGNTTRITYDSAYRVFPEIVTNAKGHIERVIYCTPSEIKGLFGQVKSRIDANGSETAFEYDGFGRKTKITGPYDLSSSYGSESYEYGINGPGLNYTITRTTEENGTANHLIKTDILDGFERVIQSGRESEESSIYKYVTTVYNARGEADKISSPYFKDGGLRTSYFGADSASFWIYYSYDAIARVIMVTKPDGGVISNTYNGWTTRITDENGHQKTLENNAYGLLARITENNGAQEYITGYKYDGLDNLILIADHLGNKIEYLYDSLRRRTKMIDPDMGTWEYSYDNNGNLTRSTNAKGQVINFSYDVLNRIITKDYSAQAGIEVTYNYDEISFLNGIGRRTSMHDPSGSSRWEHDKEGRVLKLTKTIDGAAYNVEWSYDAMDRVKSLVFPNSRRVSFTYNNAGLSESVDDFVQDAEYNATSLVTKITFDNPLISRFGYYPENQRLKSILTGSLQDLSYEYDKVGNVRKILDAAHSYTKEYAYDPLDRLISGDGNSYAYNPIGNIIAHNGVNLQYASGKPHALTNDGTSGYSYDNCGNMVSGAGKTISYDPENRPVAINKDGITTQFFYDGDGKRVKKTVTNGSLVTSTVYVEDLYEKEMSN